MGRGKWKPRRGGPQRFSSVHDPNAYIRGPRRDDSGSESSGPEESGGESGTASDQSESGSESSFEVITVPLSPTTS